MDNIELYEQVNPVTKTASTTVLCLANCGNENAKKIVNKMDLLSDSDLNAEDKDVLFVKDLSYEIRYTMMNALIHDAKENVIFDLPCGFTPRVIDVVLDGKIYIGGDLPPVIRRFKPVIKDMIPMDLLKNARLSIVDITSYDTIWAALDKHDGEVCVVTESLNVYLTKDERERFADNMYRLLKEKGGCWLTSDPESKVFFRTIYQIITGEELVGLIHPKETIPIDENPGQIGDIIKLQDQTVVGKGTYTGSTLEQIEEFYSLHGLRVEKIPYAVDGFSTSMLDQLDELKAKEINAALKKLNIWKFTVDPFFVSMKKKGAASGSRGLNVFAKKKGDVLKMSFNGQIDSINAPKILEVWDNEKTSGDIKLVDIDCSRLTYISSAGLRSLLVIKKALPTRDLRLKNVSSEVMGIFESSGFVEFFEIY